MKVNIAGYNIDKSLIDTLDELKATPEVISAAYARISRSSKDVSTLRHNALKEVEKARESNNNIIFDMGHSSIAEHVVFNIDILDVSRYLTEFIQKSRLASFTEKSQRYVTFTSKYYVPEELEGTLKEEYIELMESLFASYEKMYEIAKNNLIKNNFSGSKRDLEGKAKEDARYILPLATYTQMGATINARSLERLLRRLDACGLEEAKRLKKSLAEQVKKIAPSVIKYTEAEEYEKPDYFKPFSSHDDSDYHWKMNYSSSNPDLKILAYYIFENTGESIDKIETYLSSLTYTQLKDMFKSIFENMKSYHLPVKAFEAAEFEFQFDVSSSCYAQLKRHRMATIIKGSYNLSHGYIIPPQMKFLDQTEEYRKSYERITKLASKLDGTILPYILTNAHKVRVIMKANLRELYHFSRLRSDKHAQWEIQELSDFLTLKIKEIAPLSAALMMGKDQFNRKNSFLI